MVAAAPTGGVTGREVGALRALRFELSSSLGEGAGRDEPHGLSHRGTPAAPAPAT